MTDSPPLVEHNRNLPLLPDLHNKPLQPQTIRDVGLESMGIGKSDTWKISLPFLHINMEEAGFAVQAMQSVCIYCRLDSKATARQAVLFVLSKCLCQSYTALLGRHCEDIGIDGPNAMKQH
ncbi:uncharacterized [Tachysurus ichikawai]